MNDTQAEAALGASPQPPRSAAASQHSSVTGEDFWNVVRQAYPRQDPLLNLNNASASPPALIVEAAVTRAFELISRNPDVNMWNNLDTSLPETKRRLAAIAHCDPDEIALNRNSTEGLCTAIFGIPLRAGDQVLLSEWDYPSVRAAWLQRQEREGIDVVAVPFDLLDSDADIVTAYTAAITPRTRVMQLTHMSHWTGRVFPAAQLCDVARGQGVITVLDAAQTFAQLPLSFEELGCDYFVTSLHKWLGAPVGNGMLIIRKERIDETWPLLAPFDPPPLNIDKFDHWNLGTYNSALQSAILPAIEFHCSLGTGAIHARLNALSHYWIAQAGDIEGFRLHTPIDTENLGAVTLFSVEGVGSFAIEQALRTAHHVHVKYRRSGQLEGLRVSPHIYTLKHDLDTFVTALRAVVHDLRSERS